MSAFSHSPSSSSSSFCPVNRRTTATTTTRESNKKNNSDLQHLSSIVDLSPSSSGRRSEHKIIHCWLFQESSILLRVNHQNTEELEFPFNWMSSRSVQRSSQINISCAASPSILLYTEDVWKSTLICNCSAAGWGWGRYWKDRLRQTVKSLSINSCAIIIRVAFPTLSSYCRVVSHFPPVILCIGNRLLFWSVYSLVIGTQSDFREH